MTALDVLTWEERHLMNERERLENRLRRVAAEMTALLERDDAPAIRIRSLQEARAAEGGPSPSATSGRAAAPGRFTTGGKRE